MSQPLLDTSALIAVGFFVVLNALFVAAEFALVTVRWTRVEELVEKNVFGAKGVKALIEDMNGTIAAVQLGITFTSLALGWLGEPAFAHLVEPLFHRVPGPFDEVIEHGVAVALSFLAITYLHTVLGEQVPKALALQRSEQVALLLGGPLLVFARVFRPFIAFINHSSDFFVRLMRLPPPKVEEEVHTAEELDMLVEESEEAGLITPDEATYVRNVFELSDKTARDAMVPREKVVTLSLGASEEEVLETARETAHTRMPVWEGSPDNIVGIVNTKDLFHLFSLRGLVILMDAMYPPLFASPDVPVAQLLQLFKREKRPMAVVRDDAGVFLGIVTLEDILEEIVGEIEDEHDAPRRLAGDSMPRLRPAAAASSPTPAPAAPAAPPASTAPPQTISRPLPPERP